MSKLILLIEFVATGLVLIGICIPLILGWIRPNPWYGFRTSRTLADPKIWYPANALAGQRLAAAALTIVSGAIAFYFVPKWELLHYAIANFAVTAFALGYAIMQSAMDLKGLKPEEKDTIASEELELEKANEDKST